MRSSHVSRKVTKSQSGGKPVKVRVRVRGRKERVGKTSESSHGVAQGDVGGRAIHSQSELEKMIKIGRKWREEKKEVGKRREMLEKRGEFHLVSHKVTRLEAKSFNRQSVIVEVVHLHFSQ